VVCPSHPRLPYKGAAPRAGILYEWCATATQDYHIRGQRLVLGYSMSGVPQQFTSSRHNTHLANVEQSDRTSARDMRRMGDTRKKALCIGAASPAHHGSQPHSPKQPPPCTMAASPMHHGSQPNATGQPLCHQGSPYVTRAHHRGSKALRGDLD